VSSLGGWARHRASIAGRDRELALIDEVLAGVRAGQGGAVFFVGESGIGKSRLADNAADRAFTANITLMRGRSSALGQLVPFRSLTEALLSLLRGASPLDLSVLGPYRPVLAKLVPDLGPVAEAPDDSLVILAEAVLRLTALAGAERGCLMVLDDLQDADPETLAVVEYVVDNLRTQPTVLIGTVRNEPCPALELARAAARRGSGVLVELERLSRDQLAVLVASELDTAPDEVPDAALDLLWAGSAGNPFLTEELLSGMRADGLLRQQGGKWVVESTGRAAIPATLARSVTNRVELLTKAARDVLVAAAVLGQRFPFAVLPAMSGREERELLGLLHGELADHLIEPDEETPDWYAFKHRLIREALLTQLPPTERVTLAASAASAIERVYPGLPGEWCSAVAGLRLAAGERVPAGLLFAEAGRRALAAGAASSSVSLLDRALELLADGTVAERVGALEDLINALTEAGLVKRALASVELFDRLSVRVDRRRRARLHTRLAWAAVIAGRPVNAAQQVAAARSLLGPDAAPADVAPIDVVAAHQIIDEPGPDKLRRAEELARRAVAVAEAESLPEVACQALQLLAALVRSRDPSQATAYLDRSREIAEEHGLPVWEIHALVRMGNEEAFSDGSLTRLLQARQLATSAGAVTARYQAEGSIAFCQVLMADFEAAGELLDQVYAAVTRLELHDTAQYVLLARAVLAAHRGRRAEMNTALASYRQMEPGAGTGQPQNGPRIYGLAKAFCALLEENRERAAADLRTALAAEAENPTVLLLTGRYGLRILLDALTGDLDLACYREQRDDPAGQMRWDRLFAEFGHAVLLGRAGLYEEANAAVAAALRLGEPYVMARHLGLRLISEAALADGWADPVDWLRAAEAYFRELDVAPVASACRALLRQSGVKVSRLSAGADEVPEHLRAVGVTGREYEVLQLIAARLANREIAARLHLSPRTVERHVSNLIAKTGQPNRRLLSEYAANRE
jgi:DNA-binding CsgD family transcriptional regulator